MNMHNKFIILVLLIFLEFSCYSYGECIGLSEGQVEAVKTPLKKLLEVKDEFDEDGYVPSSISRSIEQLKTGLINLVDARITCEGSDINALAIQQDLSNKLKINQLDEDSAIYGYDLQIVIQKTLGLLVVHLTFGIPCGNDNMLMVYRYRDEAWQRDLIWKSNAYKNIAGAFGDYFDYLLLPSKFNETPKLVVIHGAPWCKSTWSPFTIDVVKLAEDTNPQKILLHKQMISYTGNESDLTLKKLASGFELRMQVGMLDSDLFTRQGIYRYQIIGDKILRVQPVADNVRDFVDEWLTLDNITAVNLVEKSNLHMLSLFQRKLKERYGYYGAVQACHGDGEEYQVTMTFNGTKENDKEDLYYFIVKTTRFGYLLKAISQEADPNCTGPDIMAKK